MPAITKDDDSVQGQSGFGADTQRPGKRWKWTRPGACKCKKRLVRREGIEPSRGVNLKGF